MISIIPSRSRRGFTAALVALALMPASAPAQDRGAELAPIRGTFVEGEFDLRVGHATVIRSTQPLYRSALAASESRSRTLSVDVSVTQVAGGCDIDVSLENLAAVDAPLGAIVLSGIALGDEVSWRDFRVTGEARTAQHDTFTAKAGVYPDNWYSPVAVLQNDTIAVGASLLHNVLEYGHDVSAFVRAERRPRVDNAALPASWQIEFRLGNIGGENQYTHLDPSGVIGGGERRTVRVCVRIAPADRWLETLAPYRDHFQRLHGKVRYERDPRPVRGMLLASTEHASDDNPFGYFDIYRPDLHGWGTVVNEAAGSAGWERIMLWLPSGVYREHTRNNMPFNFATPWRSSRTLMEATDPSRGLPRIAASGLDLGLWWGRACQVADQWDDPELEPMDPSNQRLVRLAFDELDLAAEAGSETIGLDTFTPGAIPLEDLLVWLSMMRERHPPMRFVTEPISCDLLHNRAPAFVMATNLGKPETYRDLLRIHTRHYLADYLNPGHETWGAFQYHHHWSLGLRPDEAMVARDARRLARMGFVPVMFTKLPIENPPRAAETWTVEPGEVR